MLFLASRLKTLRGARAAAIGRLGDGPYKGLYSLVAAVGLVLIVWGFSRYRSAGYIQVWNPPFSLFHPIALVLLWFALVALAATYAPPSRIKSIMRHPMLAAVKLATGNEGICQLSVEERMGCGNGSCNGCVVPVRGGDFVRSCIEGPVFRAEALAW